MTRYTCDVIIANDWGRARNAICWLAVAWGWVIPVVVIIMIAVKELRNGIE